MPQKFITKCAWLFITKCDSFITKCNIYYKTKCDVYYKIRHFTGKPLTTTQSPLPQYHSNKCHGSDSRSHAGVVRFSKKLNSLETFLTYKYNQLFSYFGIIPPNKEENTAHKSIYTWFLMRLRIRLALVPHNCKFYTTR